MLKRNESTDPHASGDASVDYLLVDTDAGTVVQVAADASSSWVYDYTSGAFDDLPD